MKNAEEIFKEIKESRGKGSENYSSEDFPYDCRGITDSIADEVLNKCSTEKIYCDEVEINGPTTTRRIIVIFDVSEGSLSNRQKKLIELDLSKDSYND